MTAAEKASRCAATPTTPEGVASVAHVLWPDRFDGPATITEADPLGSSVTLVEREGGEWEVTLADVWEALGFH